MTDLWRSLKKLLLVWGRAKTTYVGLPGGASRKEPVGQCRKLKRRRFNPWVRKFPWRRQWQPTPVFLPGKSHGQGSLVGYSPWGLHRVRDDSAAGHNNTAQKLFLWYNKRGWIHVAICLWKPSECTILRVNPEVNCGFWVAQCQCIDCNKCTTCWGLLTVGRLGGGQGFTFFCTLTSFCWEPKTSLTMKSV